MQRTSRDDNTESNVGRRSVLLSSCRFIATEPCVCSSMPPLPRFVRQRHLPELFVNDPSPICLSKRKERKEQWQTYDPVAMSLKITGVPVCAATRSFWRWAGFFFIFFKKKGKEEKCQGNQICIHSCSGTYQMAEKSDERCHQSLRMNGKRTLPLKKEVLVSCRVLLRVFFFLCSCCFSVDFSSLLRFLPHQT